MVNIGGNHEFKGGMMYFMAAKKPQGSELPVLLGVGDTPVLKKTFPVR